MNRLIAVIAMTIYTTKLVLSRLNADWNTLKAKYIHIQWRVSWTVKSEANLGKWYVSWGNSLLFSHDEFFQAMLNQIICFLLPYLFDLRMHAALVGTID